MAVRRDVLAGRDAMIGTAHAGPGRKENPTAPSTNNPSAQNRESLAAFVLNGSLLSGRRALCTLHGGYYADARLGTWTRFPRILFNPDFCAAWHLARRRRY